MNYGKRLLPEYLVRFIKEATGIKSNVYSRRLIPEPVIKKIEMLYALSEKTDKPSNFGRRQLSTAIVDKLLNTDYIDAEIEDFAYISDVPGTALRYAKILGIGGMSYKCYNLANVTNTGNRLVLANGNLSIDEGYNTTDYVEVIEGETYSTNIETYATTYYASVAYYDSNKDFVSGIRADTNVKTITIPSGIKYMRASYRLSLQDNLIINKGSTLLPYQPYFTGIRDSAVTSVISKDSNNTTLDTLIIPAEVQALEGYGWGLNDSLNNGFSYEAKKNIQKINRLKIKDLTWEYGQSGNHFRFISNVVNNLKSVGATTTPNLLSNKLTAYSQDIYKTLPTGVSVTEASSRLLIRDTSISTAEELITKYGEDYVYFELATPVETDISEYIKKEFIKVSSGGTLTFTNEYEQDVPSLVEYIVEA